MVMSALQRNDKTQRYHPRVLEVTIENVLKEMYCDLYKANPRLLDNHTKTYGATTPVAVSFEQSSGIYYSTLPAPVVNIPSKASGVLHIYPLLQTGNVFVPMDAREADILFGTDVATVTNKIGYRTKQNNRVDYFNMNATIEAAGVRMDLLIPFSSYTDSEYVNIPELSEKEGSFMARVLTVLAGIPPVDLKDDNAEAKEQNPNPKR